MYHEGAFPGLIQPCLHPYWQPRFSARVVRCKAKRTTMLGSQNSAKPDTNPTGDPQRLSAQQLMADARVEMAVRMIAPMFGLSRATVFEIVAVGLPMIAAMSERNPELSQRLYVASRETLPERIEEFYTRMMASPPVRQAVMDDYKATYGAMLDAVNRAAARQAGTTDGQARDVMAAVLPAVTQVLGSINLAGDERGFSRCLRDLQERSDESDAMTLDSHGGANLAVK
jgi:hypothetical protein